MRILCATDLGEAADEALRQASALAALEGAALDVVHVLADSAGGHPILALVRPHAYADLPERARRAGETVARRAGEVTGRAASELAVHVESGAPHARILELAESAGADLIVVGHHGPAGPTPRLIGRVAETVVRHAHCPVLVARPRAQEGPVLAATDLSDPALPAVAAAARYAARRGRALTLLHSLDLPLALPVPEAAGLGVPPIAPLSEEDKRGLRSGVESRLREALARFAANGESRVEDGPADATILRVAEELRAELIVVGTLGRTGLRRLLLGSVAEAVVRGAACSVLVVRLHPAWQP